MLRSSPRMVTPLVSTVTDSRYVPGPTRIRPPSATRSSAAVMVAASTGTLMIADPVVPGAPVVVALGGPAGVSAPPHPASDAMPAMTMATTMVVGIRNAADRGDRALGFTRSRYGEQVGDQPHHHR